MCDECGAWFLVEPGRDDRDYQVVKFQYGSRVVLDHFGGEKDAEAFADVCHHDRGVELRQYGGFRKCSQL